MSCLRVKKYGILFIVFISLTFFGFLALAGAEAQVSLPKTMIWSCYDVGASGYVQASAIADALSKNMGSGSVYYPPGHQ